MKHGRVAPCRSFAAVFGLAAVLLFLAVLAGGGCRTAVPEADRAEVYRPVLLAQDVPRPAAADAAPPLRAAEEDVAANNGGEEEGPVEVRLRLLQPGDRMDVYLHGIPDPKQLPTVVDEGGFITMPLIGQVRVSGMTGSEVERLIERLYIEQEFYRSITCVVIPPAIQFFVRGEVRQPGRYPLTRDVTLLQAIAMASGYTEYAQPRRITFLRGNDSFRVNALRVERGQDLSPGIEPGDVIVVPRRWW